MQLLKKVLDIVWKKDPINTSKKDNLQVSLEEQYIFKQNGMVDPYTFISLYSRYFYLDFCYLDPWT